MDAADVPKAKQLQCISGLPGLTRGIHFFVVLEGGDNHGGTAMDKLTVTTKDQNVFTSHQETELLVVLSSRLSG